MKCIVCGSEMKPYFKKQDMNRLRHFVKCGNCGLVIDETTYELEPLIREKENSEFHKAYQGHDNNIVDPKWIDRLEKQSMVFVQLFYENIFPMNLNIVDYGCGDGKLSNFFHRQIKRENTKALAEIKKYDKYMNIKNDQDYLTDADMKQQSFDVVITCSVFEHLIGKEDIEEILGLLNENGIFCLHTLVCEEVPKDPDWYYLLPVHCTIWTNKAMEILYKNNGFKGCAYNVEARMWFMFKDKEIYRKLEENHKRVEGTWIFSKNFVDYWKQKPY